MINILQFILGFVIVTFIFAYIKQLANFLMVLLFFLLFGTASYIIGRVLWEYTQGYF